MKVFIPWARENHVKSQQQLTQDDGTDDEPETWTPQYTPPPMDEEDHEQIMETWTPQYSPPPETECGVPRGWTPPHDLGKTEEGKKEEDDEEDHTEGLFKPPGISTNNNDDGWSTTNNGWDFSGGWDDNNEANGIGAWTTVPEKVSNSNINNNKMTDGTFHANAGAAAADEFYSRLTRNLDTRADSRLYHMRAFNGWVKATQIAELDPDTSSSAAANNGKKRSRRAPLRVLDLACGKGGDLGKWVLHQRCMENYVGVDVARGSLIDAAIRARDMAKRKASRLRKCTFTLADLGEDVPGRRRSLKARRMQKLLTWTLQNETDKEKQVNPKFVAEEGGGIAETDKFDVISIQFAIHYMMSTRKRARRFFHTVSSLLEIGGNLIATTIDARVVIEKIMALGLDLHFDEFDYHEEVDEPSNEDIHHNGNKRRRINDENEVTVTVGSGVCRLRFDGAVIRKIFQPSNTADDMFGLQYTFTLVEGADHAAGVGEAVDLPEWLTPLPALKELAEEAGLEMEYASNFHSFYAERKDPAKFPAAHNALYNMKVLNRNGTISEQEWEVSRMYVAVKFRKVRESTIHISDEDIGEDEM
jgi:mRNA (guanine-N7-)-methyltransferase